MSVFDDANGRVVAASNNVLASYDSVTGDKVSSYTMDNVIIRLAIDVDSGLVFVITESPSFEHRLLSFSAESFIPLATITFTAPHVGSIGGMVSDTTSNRLFVSVMGEGVYAIDELTLLVLGFANAPAYRAITVDMLRKVVYIEAQSNIWVVDESAASATRLFDPQIRNIRALTADQTSGDLYIAGDAATGGQPVVAGFSYPLNTRRFSLGLNATRLALDASRNHLLVGFAESRFVTSVDTSDGSTFAVLPQAGTVTDLSLSADGARGFASTGGMVVVFDQDSLAVVNLLGTSTGSMRGVAVNTVTGKFYTVGWDTNTLYEVDESLGVMTRTLAVGNGPLNVAVNESTNTLYVTNYWSNTVMVIDANAWAVIRSVTLPSAGPNGIAYNPRNARIYVSGQANNTIYSIDPATGSFVTIPTELGAAGVAVDPNTGHVFVTAQQRNVVVVIDSVTDTRIGNPIIVGSQPTGIAINENTGLAYVANAGSSTTSVIRISTNSVIRTVNVHGTPYFVAVNSNTNEVYSSSYSEGYIDVFDGSTGGSLTSLKIGSSAFALKVDPVTSKIAVSNDKLGIMTLLGEDSLAPSTTITTPSGSQAFVGWFVSPVTGVVTDDRSGTMVVNVTFVSAQGLAATSTASLMCNGSATSCQWSADNPVTPGTYTVRAWSVDRSGNVESVGASIVETVI
ncbi:MAG: hypothetical protein ABR507_02565 [Actinomycetota bacterium]